MGLQSLLLVPCIVLAPSPPPSSGGGIGVRRATPSTGSVPIGIGTPPVASRLHPAGVGFHSQRHELSRTPNGASEQILAPNGLEGRPSCALIQMGDWRVPAEAREPTSRRPGCVPRGAGGGRYNPAFVRRRKNRLRELLHLDKRGLMDDPFVFLLCLRQEEINNGPAHKMHSGVSLTPKTGWKAGPTNLCTFVPSCLWLRAQPATRLRASVPSSLILFTTAARPAGPGPPRWTPGTSGPPGPTRESGETAHATP